MTNHGRQKDKRKAAAGDGSALLDLTNLPAMAELLGANDRGQAGGAADEASQGGGGKKGEESVVPRPSGPPGQGTTGFPPKSAALKLTNIPSMSELLGEDGGGVGAVRIPDQNAAADRSRVTAPWPRYARHKERAAGDRREYQILKRPPLPRPRYVVIDGSNICRREAESEFDGGQEASSLTLLLRLALFLMDRRIGFRCLFDASERFVLARNGRWPQSSVVYGELLRFAADFFSEVPGGQSADDLILQIATRRSCPVISNDRFDKIRDAHAEQYPWLQVAQHRLLKAEVESEGWFRWPALGVRLATGGDPRPVADELLAIARDR